ncbi:hypothetical protein ACFLQ0_00265 [Nitrospinota bacterium]
MEIYVFNIMGDIPEIPKYVFPHRNLCLRMVESFLDHEYSIGAGDSSIHKDSDMRKRP